MKTTFKTAKALTNEFIKTIKTAEKSNAQYLLALAKLAKDGKVTYNDLHATNKQLNEATKSTGITTFKNVAMIVGRMYDKKTVKGKSTPYQLNLSVIDSVIALGVGASMAKLQAVRKEGKEVQKKTTEKTAKTVTGTAEDVVQVDVKKEVQSIKDEVIQNATQIAKLSKDDLTDKFYDLLSSIEDMAQTFDPAKNPNQTAVIIAKMESLASSF